MRMLAPGEEAGVHVFQIDDHGATPPHDHLFHEIVVVLAGTADHVTVEGRQKLRPGDVIVMRPQIWHGYEHPQKLSLINCLFDGRLIHRLDNLLTDVSGVLDMFGRRTRQPRHEAPLVLHARPAERASILESLNAVMDEQRRKRRGWSAAVTLGMLEVLLATVRLWCSEAEPSRERPRLSDRSEQAVLDCVAYLEEHYHEPVDLEMMAGRMHLSPAHLSRAFSRRMGMGMVAFTHCLRVEEACRLLRLTDEPISIIASRCGYKEVAYFNRCFKRQTGQSPTAYRRAVCADRRHLSINRGIEGFRQHVMIDSEPSGRSV